MIVQDFLKIMIQLLRNTGHDDQHLQDTPNFPLESARYIKLRATKNTVGNDAAGYAEIDIITK